MLFNTFDFLIFFLLFFGVYWWLLDKNLKHQNFFLLVASYVFYGWWDWRFLSLIFLTTLTSYVAAQVIEDKNHSKKRSLIFTLVLNFGILFYFKYTGFFIDLFNDLMKYSGHSTSIEWRKVLLPVGISFYTFQSLSYVIDVYRKQLKASRNFVEFAAFVSFFPQLVAGPIERAGQLLPQIQKKRHFDYDQAKVGLRYILWGLFKKMFIADSCAPLVEEIFSNHATVTSPTLWLGAFLFGIQIYCDFSAYSEIAIGTGKLLGIELMQNFRFPYFAINIKDFWKRWHISLTTWFKDYVFLPLGGSRVSFQKTIINVFIVFVLSGLWHGANVTFLIWGLYHAFLYIIFIAFIERSKISIPSWLAVPITFALVLIGWVFFRAPSMSIAFDYLNGMFVPKMIGQTVQVDGKVLIGILLLFGMEWFNRTKKFGLDLTAEISTTKRWALYFFFLTILLIYGNFDEQSFIYFNF